MTTRFDLFRRRFFLAFGNAQHLVVKSNSGSVPHVFSVGDIVYPAEREAYSRKASDNSDPNLNVFVNDVGISQAMTLSDLEFAKPVEVK